MEIGRGGQTSYFAAIYAVNCLSVAAPMAQHPPALLPKSAPYFARNFAKTSSRIASRSSACSAHMARYSRRIATHTPSAYAARTSSSGRPCALRRAFLWSASEKIAALSILVGNHRYYPESHYHPKQGRQHPADETSQCRESQHQEDDYQEEMQGANADLIRLHDAADIPASRAT